MQYDLMGVGLLTGGKPKDPVLDAFNSMTVDKRVEEFKFLSVSDSLTERKSTPRIEVTRAQTLEVTVPEEQKPQSLKLISMNSASGSDLGLPDDRGCSDHLTLQESKKQSAKNWQAIMD